MNVNLTSLLLSAKGRIDRKTFWICFAFMTVFIIVGNSLLRRLGVSMTGFYLSLVFPFLALYMLYCIYAKRLHDMGRSAGPFFIMLALEILAIVIVMLVFGGADYFSEFSGYSRAEDIDPAVTQAIIEKYQAKLVANNGIIRVLLLTVPLGFTAWTGFTPGSDIDNPY